MDVSNVTETASPQTLRQHSVTMRWSDAFFDKFRRSIGNRSLNTLVDLIREYIRCLKSDITPSHPNPRGAYAFTASIASTLHAFHMRRCDIVESSELRGGCCTGPTYTSYVHSITELIAIYADMRLRSEQLNNEYADRIAHSVILMAQKYLETEYFQAVDVILRMTKLNQHVSAVCEPVFEYILGSIPATTALTPINFTRLVLAYRRRKALYETIEEKANVTNRGSAALRALGGAPAGFAMHPLCKKVLKIVIPARATDVPRYLLATGFNTMGAITEFFKWLKTYPESENSLDGFRSLSLNEKPTRRIQSRRQQALQNRCARPAEPIFIDLTDDVDDTVQRKNVPSTSSDTGSPRTSRSTQIVPKRPAASNVEPLCIDLTDEMESSPPKPTAESIQPNKQPEAQPEQPARILNNRPPPVVVDRKNFLAKIIGLAQQAKKNQILLETEPADKEIPAPTSDGTPGLLEKDSTEDSSMEIVPRVVYSGPESSSIDRYTVSKCIDHFESPDSGIEASPTYDNESGTELPSSIESSMKGDGKTLKSLDRHEFYETAVKSCSDDKCFDSENSTERHDVPVERDRFAAHTDERSIDIDSSYYSDVREEVSKHSSIEANEEAARNDETDVEETRDVQKTVPYGVEESESNNYKEVRVEVDTASDLERTEQVCEIETAPKDIVSSRQTDVESVEETAKQAEEKKSIEGTIHVTNIEFLQNSELNGRRSVTYDSAEEKDRDEETSIEDRLHSKSKMKRKILGSIAEFVEKFSGSLRNYDDVDEPVIDVTGLNDDCSSDAGICSGLSEKISAVHISPKSDKVVSPINLQMFGGYTNPSVYPEQVYETKPEYYNRFDIYRPSEQTSSRFKTNCAETKNQPKHFVTLASRKIFDPPAIDTLGDNSVPFVSKIPNGEDTHVELKIPTLQAVTDVVENEPEVPCGVHKEIIKLRPGVELTDEHKTRIEAKPDKTKKQVRIKLPEIEVKKQNSLRNVRIDPKLSRDSRTNNGSVDEPKKPTNLKSIQTDQDSFENFFKCKYIPNENGTILNSDSDTAKSPSPSKTTDASANTETAKTTTAMYFGPTVGFDEPEATKKKPARYEQVQKVSTYTEDGVKLIVPILKIRKEDVDAGKEAKKKEKRERRRLEKPRVGFGMWETTYCHGASSKKNETIVEERRKQSEVILKNKTGKEFSIATNGPFTTKRQTGILIKRDYGKLPPGRASLEDDVRNTKIAVRRPSLEETITASRTVSNHHAHVEVTKTGIIISKLKSKDVKDPITDPIPDPSLKRGSRTGRAGPKKKDKKEKKAKKEPYVVSRSKRKSESGRKRRADVDGKDDDARSKRKKTEKRKQIVVNESVVTSEQIGHKRSTANVIEIVDSPSVAVDKKEPATNGFFGTSESIGFPLPNVVFPDKQICRMPPKFPIPKNLGKPRTPEPPDLYPEFSNSPKFMSDEDGALKKRMLDEALDSLSDIPPYNPSPEIPKQARVVSEIVDVKPAVPWPVEIKTDDGSSDAWPDRTDDNAFLPFKKRKLTSEEERIRNQIKTERWKMSDVNVSYPSTPMISIAELALEHYDINRRMFKTPAQLKALPPLPPAYVPQFTAVVSDVLGSNLNINNHTYNYPTINYHVNGVPFLNFDCNGSYGVSPVVVSTLSCEGSCGTPACRGVCAVRQENFDKRNL